jgi:hypothetical protein
VAPHEWWPIGPVKSRVQITADRAGAACDSIPIWSDVFRGEPAASSLGSLPRVVASLSRFRTSRPDRDLTPCLPHVVRRDPSSRSHAGDQRGQSI